MQLNISDRTFNSLGRKSYALRKYFFILMIVVGVALFIYKVRDDSDLFQTSYTITMVYTTIYIVYLCNETFYLYIQCDWGSKLHQLQ